MYVSPPPLLLPGPPPSLEGGDAGSVVQVRCFDPRQMNMKGASYTIGDTGAAGTGNGGDGSNSTFTGAIPPFNGGTWTLPDWVALTAYTKNTASSMTSYVLPTVGNAGNYEFADIAGGTTGAGPVTWPQTPGATVVDGTVTWENMGHAVWTSGGTVVVDTSQTYPLGTLIGPATAQNAGSYFYMAIQPGTSGVSGHPTWPQKLLSEVSDATVIWQAVAASMSIQAGGGGGGQSSGATTVSVDIPPKGIAGSSSSSGCTQQIVSLGVPGSGAIFNLSTGFGHSGTGGSNVLSRGGLGQPVVNTSTQVTGNPGSGPGAGGAGAISAINNAGTNKNGGVGIAGELYIAPMAGASP